MTFIHESEGEFNDGTIVTKCENDKCCSVGEFFTRRCSMR